MSSPLETKELPLVYLGRPNFSKEYCKNILGMEKIIHGL